MAWLMITARFKVSGIVLLTILVNLSHQLEQPIHVHPGSCASIGYTRPNVVHLENPVRLAMEIANVIRGAIINF